MDNSLIKRQAAIDGLYVHYIERINLNDWQAGWNAALDWMKDAYLDELPSAQPEVIHCHDCKYGTHGGCGDRYFCIVSPELRMEHEGDFYCGYGKRREDGQTY